MYIKHLCVFLIVIAFFGCHSGEKRNAGKVGDISIVRLENTDSLLLSAVIDSVSYLPLIEQDDFLFANINK
ncbi:MAG: 6-bladed beta-propeller, partial [Prevotellaceae bacterium]|nr:6-bladed beta-propeller [Prevotellaceae bacterium]